MKILEIPDCIACPHFKTGSGQERCALLEKDVEPFEIDADCPLEDASPKRTLRNRDGYSEGR